MVLELLLSLMGQYMKDNGLMIKGTETVDLLRKRETTILVNGLIIK